MMTVLLDTDEMPPTERVEAIRAGLTTTSKPTHLQLSGVASAKISMTRFGTDMRLIDVVMTAEEWDWDVQRPRHSDRECFSLSINRGGSCLTDSHGTTVTSNALLRSIDVTRAHTIRKSGRCRTVACEIDYTRLGLEIDTVRAAMPNIASSPLSEMAARRMLDIAAHGNDIDPAAHHEVGLATTHLVRAVILSASPARPHRRAAHAETLQARVEDYIQRNLGDPDLKPAEIAAAHHISLRQLYVIFAGRSETPAEWIMTKRLEAAKNDLTSSQSSITAIAHRWGFRDHSHFTRRFKTAYGSTPRQALLDADQMGARRSG